MVALVGQSVIFPDLALSIRQPWAWAIVNLGKDIENRSWRTKFRGQFCIHASKGMTRREYDAVTAGFSKYERDGYRAFNVDDWPKFEDLARGGIVGIATLTDCVERHDSPWFDGAGFGFVLADVHPVEFQPVKGALSFFRWRDQVPA